MTEQPKQTISPEPVTELSNDAPDTSNTSDSAPETQHSALLAHYHNLEKIGHGAQATMLKALDERERPVAIKIFDYKNAKDWKDVELFEREIDVLKNLNIEGVPKYIETIKTDHTIYLVEEYIHALSLEKQIRNGRIFSVKDCITILGHAAAILSKLAGSVPPVVHRDIKPANIIVDDELNVYLVDFGVVANTAQTFSMTFAGTAGYVAPEQLYGKATPASDIFSLGATMLHLVSRVAPCDMKLKGILPDFDRYIPKSIPGWFSDIIKKMMSSDPENRPQNGNELLELIKKSQRQNIRHSNSNASKWAPGLAAIIILAVIVIVYANIRDTGTANKTNNTVNDAQSTSANIPPSYALLLEKANQGDAKAQHDLGYKYYYGEGITQDRQEALKWYLKSAEQGYMQSQANVGYMYDIGTGTEQNYEEALKWYRLAAEQGHELAQSNLANLYYHGRGTDINYEEAAKWYKAAAEQGNTYAQSTIGYLYDAGEGVEQNYNEALKWYRKAAEKGDAMAQANLGRMYDEAHGVAQDYAEAMKWYRKAADQGLAGPQNNLGVMYSKGQGVEQNYEEALKWYRMAAEQNEPWALNNLGNMYEEGEGVEQNYEEAIEWYMKAAQLGNPGAQNNLGRIYYFGKGTGKNIPKAFEWYTKAAEGGNAKAQNSLGSMYANGEGTEQDKFTAAQWYRKSAEQGDSDAQYNLGKMYLNGEGVMQDKEEALRWFKKSAEQGDEDAKAMVNQLR